MTPPHPRSANRGVEPQLMSDVDHLWQYGAYFQLNNQGYAFRRNLATGGYQLFNLALIAGNPMDMPIVDPDDDHYALTVGIGEDNVLHVFGNDHGHDQQMRYVRCFDVNNFTDPGSWEWGGNPFAYAAQDGGGYIYAQWDRMSDGTLIWFATLLNGIRDGGKGRDWVAAKWVGRQWVGLRNGNLLFCTTEDVLGSHPPIPGGPQSNPDGSAIRVYVTGIKVERRPAGDRIHAAGLWRLINAPDPAAANSAREPFYLYSDDVGATWKTITGSTQAMPITWQNRTAATITSSPPSIPVGSVGIFLDKQGYPHIVVLETGLDVLPQVWSELYWNGAAWAKTSGITNQPFQYHLIGGETWLRQRSGPFYASRITLTCKTATKRPVLLGNSVNSFTPNPDPVRLRERGIYSVLIPNGNTPDVFEFGKGARAKIFEPVTTYTPPPTIDRTGATDVTADLTAWLATVPNGTQTEPTIIELPSGVTYKVDGEWYWEDRHDITVRGHATRFVVESLGDRNRSVLAFEDCQGIWLEDVYVRGTATGAYDPDFEAQHGFEFLGCDRVTMLRCQSDHVRGDHIYMAPAPGRTGCNDVFIDTFFGNWSDRQGITVTAGDNIIIYRSFIYNPERASIDLEPNTLAFNITNVQILENEFIGGGLQWIAAGGRGLVNDVIVDGNSLIARDMQITVLNNDSPTLRRANWRVTNNTSTKGAGSTPGSGDPGGRVMGFNYVDGVIVQGNTQPKQVPYSYDMYLVKAVGCTGVDVSDNTVIGFEAELMP